ncbi:MAG: hypothetical protein Q8K63_02350 [Acidimicrobiales bacterium]|nr:hypothetical protein [Acidimicrobiales bacterium]
MHVNALNTIPALPGLADVHLAPSAANVNSAGLAAPNAGKRSQARAANVDAPLIGGALDLSGLIVEAEQTAPPTNAAPTSASLTGPVDLAPLASLEAATAAAHARWGSSDTTCIAPGTPISTARSTVLDAGLLGPLPLPTGDALISVNNANGGVSFTNSSVGLVDVAGQTNKGLKSEVLTQVDGVVLFKGSENELTLNILAPPTMQATATGTAATSTVTYNQPVVEIIQGGDVIEVLNATDANVDLQLPPGPTPLMVLRLQLGTLQDVVKTATQASGTATLLGLTLLDITETVTLARVEIAPMTVKATVPAGGVTCPPGPLSNLQVDSSTPTVLPNGQFEYAVTIPNIGACTVNNVKVVLTVTGPDGSTITGTAPPASSVSGLTATWNDIGSIAPGALKVVKATIKVPANAVVGATYTGTATASGTCDGSGTSSTATSGPVPTVGAPSDSSCDISASSLSSSHKEVRIGDFFNEYVRVSNLGKASCNTITITLNYPPNTSFVTCTDNCTHSDATRKVTWTVTNLGSGVSKDLVATFKVDPSAKSGDNLGTSVTIKSGGQTVNDRTNLPIVTSSNVLNNGVQRTVLPRTGADAPLGVAFGLMGVFVVMRGLRRRFGA